MTTLRGVLVDAPASGIGYRTPTNEGRTQSGEFTFEEGERITFALGDVTLGSAPAATRMSVAGLLVGGATELTVALHDPGVLNRARLLLTIGQAEDDAAAVESALDGAVADHGAVKVDVGEAAFESQKSVVALSEALGVPLTTPVAARNVLRRSAAGILKESDVRVPTRDGSYVLADVFRPIDGEPVPAVLRMSVYGRAFGAGSLSTDDERLGSEQREDDWFSGRREGLGFLALYSENAVSGNAHDWVPEGYAIVRVDPRGVGTSPGRLDPFSLQEAEDYYDAIEWAASEPWCSGDVGTLGASYAGTTQWNVAALKPPSLRAMIPWAGDDDGYRDLAYPGGIFNEGYRGFWWSFVAQQQCQVPERDFVGELAANPFADSPLYAKGEILTVDFDQVEVPFLTAVSQTVLLHGRSGFEAFTRARSSHRWLAVVDSNYLPFFHTDALDLQLEFFDAFLRKKDLGAAAERRVRLVMREGGGGYHWREEPTWPVPDTEYRALHLDASAGGYALSTQAPAAEGWVSYSADWDTAQPASTTGVTFVTAPLDEDLTLAGHFRAVLWVSSSAADMDVFVTLRTIGADGQEIDFAVRPMMGDAALTTGCLKVSHRALDAARSEVRPWHTHAEADSAPLTSPSEKVEIDVEILAATAVIPAGAHLELQVQPVESSGGLSPQPGVLIRRAYDETYHRGATNTIHTGSSTPSRLIIPVVPNQQEEQ